MCAVCVVGFAAIACNDVDEIPGPRQAGPSAPGAVPGRGGMVGKGVAPIAPGSGAGAMTPMSGTDSVTGSGSGVGQAAKDMAKRNAANAGNPAGMTPVEPGDNGGDQGDDNSTG